MNVNKYFIILICVFILACGRNQERLRHTITIDSDFNDKEIELIIKSIDEWKEATNNDFHAPIEIAPVNLGDEFSIFKSETLINNKENILGHTNTNDEVGEISILKNIESDFKFENIVKHELGHYLGLDHYNDKNDLMYPTLKYHTNVKYIRTHHIEEFNSYWF